MPVYEVVTAEVFTVTRRVVADNPREAAAKAVQGQALLIVNQDGDGFVEGSRVVVYETGEEEPVGEFDAWVVASDDEEDES